MELDMDDPEMMQNATELTKFRDEKHQVAFRRS